MKDFSIAALATWLTFAGVVYAQTSCPTPVATTVPAPSTAPGYESRLVAKGFTHPRGLAFDTSGHLLVTDSGVGIKALTLKDDGGSCVTVQSTKVVISNTNLNHAVEFMDGGKTILVSTSEAVFSYGYDATTMSTTTAARTLVNGMTNADHVTRTTTASKFKPGTIIVSRGSGANIDSSASVKSSGHAQVKAFDITTLGSTPYNFTTDGTLLAWGVRNDVGVAEHPTTGGIWTVENSVDDITRNGTKFNANNPGEELNYMGTLVNNTSPNQGSNFGYPECFAAYAPDQVPDHGNLQVGQQFTIRPDVISDQGCQTQRTAPRLVFDAHMAPLDIKFDTTGNNAFVSFHGSFDRPVPQGFKVSRIAFANGEPTAPSTSTTALQDIVANKNTSSCPTNCFRPVALAIDSQKRIFFSSDATGEIYVIRQTACMT